MNIHIIVNKKIYENYKDEVIDLTPRLFDTPYFYDINKYEVPFDLLGLKDHLKFVDNITIYGTPSFIDFINILLVLDYLNDNNYKGKVIVNYYQIRTKKLKDDKIAYKMLVDEYKDVKTIINSIKDNKKVNQNTNYLPGMLNFINFYNKLVDPIMFLETLKEELDESEEIDFDYIINYLLDNYLNMGLDREFYENYIKENLKEYV